MHGLAVYAREGLPLAYDLSLNNSADYYLRFQLALLHSVCYFFFLCRYLLHLYVQLLILFHLFHLCIISLVFGELTFILRTGEPILMELIDMMNSVVNFLSQMTFFRWLTFLLASLTLTLTVLFFCIYFFPLTPVFVLQRLSFHSTILIMLLSQFPLTFCPTGNRMLCFMA